MKSIDIRRASLLFTVVLTITGCATAQKQDHYVDARSAIHTVRLEIAGFAPVVKPSEGNPGQQAAKEGLTRSLATMATTMAPLTPYCVSAGPYAAGLCAAVIPMYTFFSIIEGGLGVAKGASSGNMKVVAQQTLSKALTENETQNALVSKLMNYGNTISSGSFSQLSQSGISPSDATLEVAMMKIDSREMQTGAFKIISTRYGVEMEARARLRRNSDNAILADRTYRYFSAPRVPNEWIQQGGAPLLEAIDYGYSQLAEWIIDELFLGQYSGSQLPFPTPVSPPLLGCPAFRRAGTYPCTVTDLKPVPIDSLRPTMRWNNDAMQDSTNAQSQLPETFYELRVYAAEQIDEVHEFLWPTLPVYSKVGITGNSHTLEQELLPCTNYLWTVRAITNNKGMKRVSEWSGKYKGLFFSVSPEDLRNASKSLPSDYKHDPLTQFNYIYPFLTQCEGNPKKE